MQEGIYGKLSNSQAYSSLNSTGAISTNILDLEENAVTDDQIMGFLNVTIIAATLTSGLTEGIKIALRTDDATNLATSKDGTSAGYVEVAAKEICKEDIVAGKQFSIPFIMDKAKKYIGSWVSAVSTSLTGSITVDVEISSVPVGLNESIQKVPS